jgi:hypothetical protein
MVDITREARGFAVQGSQDTRRRVVSKLERNMAG